MSEIILPEINGSDIFALVSGGNLLNKGPLETLTKILDILKTILSTLKAIEHGLILALIPPPPPLLFAITTIQTIVDGPLGHIVEYMQKQFDSFVKNLTLYAEHTKIAEAMGLTTKTKAANETLKAFGTVCGEIAHDIELIKELVEGLVGLSPEKIANLLPDLVKLVEKIFNITVEEQKVQDNMLAVLVNLQQARSYAEHINNPVLQPIFSLAGTTSLKNLLNTAIDQNVRSLGFVPPSVAEKLTHVI